MATTCAPDAAVTVTMSSNADLSATLEANLPALVEVIERTTLVAELFVTSVDIGEPPEACTATYLSAVDVMADTGMCAGATAASTVTVVNATGT